MTLEPFAELALLLVIAAVAGDIALRLRQPIHASRGAICQAAAPKPSTATKRSPA